MNVQYLVISSGVNGQRVEQHGSMRPSGLVIEWNLDLVQWISDGFGHWMVIWIDKERVECPRVIRAV